MPEFPTTAVEGDGVVFRLADPDRELTTVRLWVDVDVPFERDLARREGGWELLVPSLPVDRVEYLFEADGLLVPDPGNPLRVGGAFGDHSWLPLTGYHPPSWLDRRPVPGGVRRSVSARRPWARSPGRCGRRRASRPPSRCRCSSATTGPRWTPSVGSPSTSAAWSPRAGSPRCGWRCWRPGERNAWYSANERYAAALTEHVLPALREGWATVSAPVLMGQSLGALAALHVAWTRPRVFGGLFLQSGSYFTPELDPQESGYSHWDRVTGFVRSVHDAAPLPAILPPVTLVCGTAEENLANNRLMAEHLAALGMTVSWGEVRDGHNWTCWRDLLDPHLTDLLTAVWS